MPIKGLTDRPSRMLRSGGKLRLGRKVTKTGRDGKVVEVPEKTDYFIFDPTNESLVDVFQSLYGEKPRELPVSLPSDEVEQSFPTAYKLWRNGTLVCYGDNETGHVLKKDSYTERTDRPCNDGCPFRKLRNPPPGESREKQKQRTCEPEGTLRVRIDGLPTMEHFEVTARISSIIRLSPFLNALADQCECQTGRHGTTVGISDVPLVLRLVPEKMEQYGKFYVLELDIRTSLADVLAGLCGQAPQETDPPESDPQGRNGQKPSPFSPEEQVEIKSLLPAIEANHDAEDDKRAARRVWAEKVTDANNHGERDAAVRVLKELRIEAYRNVPGPRPDQKEEAEQLLGEMENQQEARRLLGELAESQNQDTAEDLLDRLREAHG